MRKLRFGWILALAVAWAPAAQSVEVMGDSVDVVWDPAVGDVSGYYLIVSRDGAEATLEGFSGDTRETLNGTSGQTLVIQVAAYGPDGVAGPLSDPSEPIVFVTADAGGPPPPADEPPSDPPPADEPPMDEGDNTEPVDLPPDAWVARHDLTCDGISDLVVHLGGRRYAVWEMADGRMQREIALEPAPRKAKLAGAGDYDGDGCGDLLWQRPESRRVLLWLLTDEMQVGLDRTLDEFKLPSREKWLVVGSGDTDGDGIDDVILHSAKKNGLEIWTMAASGVQDAVRLDARGSGWEVPALMDSDGDALTEVLWHDEASGSLELDSLQGSAAAFGTMQADWLPAGTGDFDGDGMDELLAHNPSTGATVHGEPSASGMDWAAMPAHAGTPVGFGDYDGDGVADVAWFDPDSRTVTVWLERGGRAVEAGQLPKGARIAPALGFPNR